MKSANGIPYAYIYDLFAKGADVDETTFYFEGETIGDHHYIGYLPEASPTSPYWAGYCDLQDGFDCATADDLFNAPYYDGKTLKERWEQVYIQQIGGIPSDLFIEWHYDAFPIDSYC